MPTASPDLDLPSQRVGFLMERLLADRSIGRVHGAEPPSRVAGGRPTRTDPAMKMRATPMFPLMRLVEVGAMVAAAVASLATSRRLRHLEDRLARAGEALANSMRGLP